MYVHVVHILLYMSTFFNHNSNKVRSYSSTVSDSSPGIDYEAPNNNNKIIIEHVVIKDSVYTLTSNDNKKVRIIAMF